MTEAQPSSSHSVSHYRCGSQGARYVNCLHFSVKSFVSANFTESMNAPAVYRPAMQEFLRRHDTVALEDQPILHHKED